MPSDAAFRPLYRVAATCAIAVVALVPFQVVVFALHPPPSTVTEWFELYQASPAIGLLDMDLLMIVDTALLAVVFLALFAALRRATPVLMTIALAAALVGAAAYFASNPAFEMLTLSERWAAAGSDAERIAALAGGEVMLAQWVGTAFSVGYVLSAIATLLASVAMLRSELFGRAAAYIGLVYGALSLVPASAGALGYVMSFLSLVPMLAWLVLLARELSRLGRGAAGGSEDAGEAQRAGPQSPQSVPLAQTEV